MKLLVLILTFQTAAPVTVPLPGLGFPPGPFEQVTLDDVAAVGTRADHQLARSVLRKHRQCHFLLTIHILKVNDQKHGEAVGTPDTEISFCGANVEIFAIYFPH